MKKNFVTVAMIAAMALSANATSMKTDQAARNTQTQTDALERDAESEADAYRTYAMESEENDKHIIRFYDINRIVIKNGSHALIRIYDDQWNLIEKTRDDVDKQVRDGNYYVTCSQHIRSRYTEK